MALVEALVDSGHLYKDLMLTEEEGKEKTYLVTAYWESERISSSGDKPTEIPPIDLGNPREPQELEETELAEHENY
jgi:hypothetical protein